MVSRMEYTVPRALGSRFWQSLLSTDLYGALVRDQQTRNFALGDETSASVKGEPHPRRSEEDSRTFLSRPWPCETVSRQIALCVPYVL